MGRNDLYDFVKKFYYIGITYKGQGFEFITLLFQNAEYGTLNMSKIGALHNGFLTVYIAVSYTHLVAELAKRMSVSSKLTIYDRYELDKKKRHKKRHGNITLCLSPTLSNSKLDVYKRQIMNYPENLKFPEKDFWMCLRIRERKKYDGNY